MIHRIYQNHKGHIHISLLLVISILALWVFSPHASAIDIAQGDILYKNETVDISMAASWPDYAVAWCKGGYYGCTPPDQVIQITGNMHKYWIDPAKWNYGTYYRWDGEWHKGENSVAFTINPGTRPVNVKNSKNETISNETMKTEMSASRSHADDLRNFIIAKGDDFTLSTHYPSKYNDSGSMWFFEFHDTILDVPLIRNDSDYSHYFSASETGKMEMGDYIGYMQFSGPNGFQDVYYDAKNDNLDTPYDDAVIPDVNLEISSPEQTHYKFINMGIPSKWNDDIRVPINLSIVEPDILVTEVVQDEEKHTFRIHGTTTWSDGTPVQIKLDPDNYALPKDIFDHTWTTVAVGNLSVIREFDITIPYDERELALGMHEIKAFIDKNYIQNTAYYNFRVSDIYVMPTPTPSIKKVFETGDSKPIPTMIKPEESKTIPVTTAPQSPVEPVVISTGGSHVEVLEEQALTPSEITATTATTVQTKNVTVTPTATRDPNIHVPLPWWVAVAAVGIAVWRRK